MADEEIEHSKHFDEEAGISHPNNREVVGSSKAGYHVYDKKQDVSSSSAAGEGDAESRSKEIRTGSEEKRF